MLITADTKFRVQDASGDFKDKFVFFSPKITFGVDFSAPEPQGMLIYMAGNSLQPSGVYQQATRTRNIKTLYYYGECSADSSRYGSLAEVKADVEHAVQTSKLFNKLCSYIDEFDEVRVVQNTFLNLYCYNAWVKDLYASNKLMHFQLLLNTNGFKLSSEGEVATLGKNEEAHQTEVVTALTTELFDEFLAARNKYDDKYTNFLKQVDYLKLPIDQPEILKQYQTVITDKYACMDHDAIIRFLKSEEYVNSRVTESQFKCFDPKVLTNRYHKLKLVRDMEAKFGLNVWGQSVPTQSEMSEDFYRLIKTTFGTKLARPTTAEQVFKMYANLVKSCASRQFINCTQGAIKLNTAVVAEHLALNKYKNPRCLGFSDQAVETFKIQVQTEEPVEAGIDMFLD